MSNFKLLVINPGSTSTKIAVFEDEEQIFKATVRHALDELKGFKNVFEQIDYRLDLILKELSKANYTISDFSAVVARGGMLRPLESGTYEVNEAMLDDLRSMKWGEHASSLGAIIAWELCKDTDKKSYMVDPVCVDELESLAKYTGIKNLSRASIFHALNVKSVARQYAKSIGKNLSDVDLIVAHMGGGITVSALRKGRAVEVNHGIYEGPFSPERCGNIANLTLLNYCKNLDPKRIKELIAGKGGLADLLGTSDALEVEKRIENGDDYAREVFESMAYKVSQEIGARATVLFGRVDAIIITGGLAYSRDYLNKWIEERVRFIAPVVIIPGENEMQALSLGAIRVLSGEEKAKIY